MTARTRFTLAAAMFALATAGGVAAQNQTSVAPNRPNADANGDGNLSRAEAVAHAESQFARFDVDGDGRITTTDQLAVREQRRNRRFDLVDANNDGTVSRSEFDSAGDAMDARLTAQREARAARLTDDNALESGERPRDTRRAVRRGGQLRLARLADTDNDQAVDRDEFMAAAAARFARMDANSDDVVTAAERQATRGQARARRR